jgi:RNA polymerase sigma-70 factor, ECF subfamily
MPAHHVSHSTIIRRARVGEVGALDQLLRAFRPYVRVIVNSVHDGRLRARLDDSDLIQDALLQAASSFSTFHGTTTAEFVMWLKQVARQTALGTVRRLACTAKRNPALEKHGSCLETLEAPSTERPSENVRRAEQADRVATAIAHLPEDMQQVLIYRHVDGMPHAVIARQMNRSESAIRMQYVRALRLMRDSLKAVENSGQL